jgi:hypothetical protein
MLDVPLRDRIILLLQSLGVTAYLRASFPCAAGTTKLRPR